MTLITGHFQELSPHYGVNKLLVNDPCGCDCVFFFPFKVVSGFGCSLETMSQTVSDRDTARIWQASADAAVDQAQSSGS